MNATNSYQHANRKQKHILFPNQNKEKTHIYLPRTDFQSDQVRTTKIET